uniref:Uncharacterized protein n=1 Tax=Attheya septentrionalis TaxID=420275 RepID=A0A7S2UJ01_9STRA|mmetsp:Transcript_27521/g.49944  ORF Transcript_27521/g.49944 Transcript_27521/m.49944 type:complete len:103 (+) Transcript_27521:159-467(+)
MENWSTFHQRHNTGGDPALDAFIDGRITGQRTAIFTRFFACLGCLVGGFGLRRNDKKGTYKYRGGDERYGYRDTPYFNDYDDVFDSSISSVSSSHDRVVSMM